MQNCFVLFAITLKTVQKLIVERLTLHTLNNRHVVDVKEVA